VERGWRGGWRVDGVRVERTAEGIAVVREGVEMELERLGEGRGTWMWNERLE